MVFVSSLRDWLFHPSVRPYFNPNSKASIYRYPSPGNTGQDHVDQAFHDRDYKTPYQYSKHNVRYIKPTPMQKDYAEVESNFDSPSLTPISK